VDDNAVRSKASATVNGRLAWKLDAATTLELQGFNLANRQVSAIDYYYASRLKGEPAGREDVHFHPIESRSFRLSVRHAF
jgi:outer membrane receptor protein involved in Fe transport